MFGVIIEVRVDPSREDEARKLVREMIVPKAKAHAGFAAGYWLRELDGDALTSVHLHDTRENAEATAASIQSEGAPPSAPVTLVSVRAQELLASA